MQLRRQWKKIRNVRRKDKSRIRNRKGDEEREEWRKKEDKECMYVYRVSQEECEILRERVPYVNLYRYNPKHLYPKLNGYGDNGQRKVWTSCISAYCTSTAVAH